MSMSRKILKVISLITFLSGISYLVAGALIAGLGLLGGADPIVTGAVSTDAKPAGTLLAAVAAVSGIVYLALGCLGVKAANVPAKIGAVCALSVVGIAFAVINIAYWAWTGFSNIDAGSLGNLVFSAAESVAISVFAGNVKKERELWH